MRQAAIKRMMTGRSALKRIAGSTGGRSVLIVAVLLGSVLLAAVVRAHNHAMPISVSVSKPSTAFPAPQGSPGPRENLHSRLSLQPEADKLRRRLGRRFVAAGKERAMLTGTLTIGANTSPVRIVRTQNDDGEHVEIALAGLPASLTWTATEGARSGAGLANGIERLLIERLALDSPDQFILAQLRGASYYTVARQARPSEAGTSEDYTGPVWDIVRIAEPQRGTANRPQSLWRLYYINSSRGLIEKVVSREGADTILVEVSDWVERGGESVPTRTRWTRSGQFVMELSLTNVAHSSGQ